MIFLGWRFDICMPIVFALWDALRNFRKKQIICISFQLMGIFSQRMAEYKDDRIYFLCSFYVVLDVRRVVI